jgi:D-arabinose 1-dehydrogenase-like Zn-dependent alcohol dehydrogenase
MFTAATRPETTANPSGQASMRAVVQDTYGSAETLELRDVARRAPDDGEVLVRVRAAGLDRGV